MTKTILALPVAALVALGSVACSDAPTGLAPEGPNRELVDAGQRIAAADVNAHVYGSFALQFTEVVGTPGGWGVIRTGPANFPGNPKNAGTCDDGLWINKNGQRTSGSLEKPHPHCVGETEGDQQNVTVHVVLEPISGRYETFGTAGERLALGNSTDNCEESDPDGLCAFLTGNEKHSRGVGVIVAYAIDASTLQTTKRRVGTLTFDLAQYHDANVNHFDTDCTIGEDETAPRCLEPTITATYTPLATGGVGAVRHGVPGFLYWSPATAPFNYGS
jgi:hypothetical protein